MPDEYKIGPMMIRNGALVKRPKPKRKYWRKHPPIQRVFRIVLTVTVRRIDVRGNTYA